MALTDTAIRNAKPGDKPKKLFDERGLFLLVQPSGGKLWRLKYRYLGKEKKLSLGRYPDVSLKVARDRRDEARTLLANGADPASVKAEIASERREAASNTFSTIADEYIAKIEKEGRAAVTIKKTQWLLSLLGARPWQAPNYRNYASRIASHAPKGRIQRSSGDRSSDAVIVWPYFSLCCCYVARNCRPIGIACAAPWSRRQLNTTVPFLKPDKVGELLRAIDGFRPAAHSFGPPAHAARLRAPGELRRAEWSEFDLGKADGRFLLRR